MGKWMRPLSSSTWVMLARIDVFSARMRRRWERSNWLWPGRLPAFRPSEHVWIVWLPILLISAHHGPSLVLAIDAAALHQSQIWLVR